MNRRAVRSVSNAGVGTSTSRSDSCSRVPEGWVDASKDELGRRSVFEAIAGMVDEENMKACKGARPSSSALLGSVADRRVSSGIKKQQKSLFCIDRCNADLVALGR